MPEALTFDAGMEKQRVEPVMLQPFLHQVGGHSGMLCYDERTVCKPLNSREHHFYQMLPKELQEFAPTYKGALEVNFEEDSNGFVTFLGYPTESKSQKRHHKNDGTCRDYGGECFRADSDSDSHDSTSSQKPENSDDESFRLRMRSSGTIEIDNLDSNSPDEDMDSGNSLEQWSARCHKKQLEKLIKDKVKIKPRKFILLENVVRHFEHPCILDLKVGTRVHGDEESDAKVNRKIKRCAETTSATWGLRLSGMQVYQASSGRYKTRNKYWGRSVPPEGFKEAVTYFFDNNSGLRTDVIDPLIKRLEEFKVMVEKSNTFRFYSSSLLIMYEGKEPNKHSRMEQQLHYFDELSCSDSTSSSTKVDIRMIDFEHSTFQGFEDDCKVHCGPDRGYLFGLDNLISTLREIKSAT